MCAPAPPAASTEPFKQHHAKSQPRSCKGTSKYIITIHGKEKEPNDTFLGIADPRALTLKAQVAAHGRIHIGILTPW